MPADHLQGQLGFGCDILTFATSEDREQFIKHSDEELVDRFIEVKGRARDDGTIELRGNELAAAQQRKQRYYLYRVYEQDHGTFDLLTLSDPCAAAAEIALSADLRRAATTEHWHVQEERRSDDN